MNKFRFGSDEQIQYGLNHLGSPRDFSNAIDLINTGKGSRQGCLGNIASEKKYELLRDWFIDANLKNFRQNCFLYSKLTIMYSNYDSSRLSTYSSLYFLCSNHPQLIDWYQQLINFCPGSNVGQKGDINNPNYWDFWWKQHLLAIAGQWDILRERSQFALDFNVKKRKRHLIDHRFYIALANQDKTQMEEILAEMTSPAVAKFRNFSFELGATENLMATYATLFAKIAWMHGIEVETNSRWIPKEWLPMTPLDHYEEPWSFLSEYDIYTPFNGNLADRSPVKRVDFPAK